jgi:hypothetical protein
MRMRIFTAWFIMAILLTFSAHAEDRFSLEVRIKNLETTPATFSFRVTRCMQDFNGYKDWDFLPLLGYAGRNGLNAEKPAKELWLGKDEDSNWMKMPGYGKVLHVYRETEAPVRCQIDIRIQNKEENLSRSFLWDGRSKTFHVYLYYIPISVKPPRLILKTADEFIDETRDYIQKEMKDFPLKRLPQKIAFATDFGCKPDDDPAWVKKNLALFKEIGMNCIWDPEISLDLSRWIKEANFRYTDHWGLGIWPISYEGLEVKRREYATNALNTLDSYERRINRDNVMVLHGDDEIGNGPLEDFLAADSRVQPLVVSYFKRMNVPLSDVGFKDYREIKLIPAGAKPPYVDALKKTNPALFYWVNRARMEYLTDLHAETGKIAARYYPDALIVSPNWPAAGVIGGGYDGHGWDFWMAYRKKGLRGIVGEPTPWYNFYLQGIFSWYADMMRSHVSGGPMSAFVTTIRGSYPCFLNHFEVYELAARGIQHFHWYSYGGMWGNENYATEIVRDLLREEAIMHREFGEAEEYLVETRSEPARVAILWTPAQEIWDASLHQELTAIYLLLLHANYPVDIISSYDVNDGCLKNYRVLYMPFAHIEKKTWSIIKSWVSSGGMLVLDGGVLKDEYNSAIPLKDMMKGYEISIKKFCDIGGLANVRYLQLLDEALSADSSIRFPVISQKGSLNAPSGARILLRYRDGSPAAFETKSGSGSILVSGFLLGTAYQRDEEDRDKPDWSSIIQGHNFSAALRNFTTSFIRQAGISRVCNIEDDMAVARRRIGERKECIVLFDYHFGNKPEQPVFPEWENIGERTVKVEIGQAKAVRSVRGSIVKRDGRYAWVKFKGVDFVLIDR